MYTRPSLSLSGLTSLPSQVTMAIVTNYPVGGKGRYIRNVPTGHRLNLCSILKGTRVFLYLEGAIPSS